MIQKPRGTQDIFFKESSEWRWLTNLFYTVLNNNNFTEILTPVFESQEVFLRSVGATTDIVQKEMYQFKDRKGRDLVLRPEFTASIARAFIENKLYSNENLPIKFFYNGPVFRYERPQAGRYRQFNQFGIEVFGNDSIDQDVEIILLAKQLLDACKIKQNFIFIINYLITGKEKQQFENSLKSAIDKIDDLCDDCKVRRQQNILRVLDCKIDQEKFVNLPSMKDFISKEDADRFNQTINEIKKFDINYKVDYKLVRGLDYYTGIVFEIINLKNNQAIIAGGRYNNLVEEIGGPKTPAIGFAVGWERMLAVIRQENIFLAAPKLDAFIIPLSTNARSLTNQLLFEARNYGISIDTNWNITNLKNGFKYAEKLNSKHIIIVGDKNIQTNQYEIKSQKDFSIIETDYENIINELIKLRESEINE